MKTASQAEHFKFFRSSSIVSCGALPNATLFLTSRPYGKSSWGPTKQLVHLFGTFFDLSGPYSFRGICR